MADPRIVLKPDSHRHSRADGSQASGQKAIRVMIVDDHPIVREGTRALLSYAQDMEVVAEAEDGEGTLVLARSTKPDVVLLDIRLKGQDGIEVAHQLRQEFPEVRIIIFTAYDLEPYVRAAVSLGVQGYILKESSSKEIEEAIRSVYAGGTVFASNVARRLVDAYERSFEKGSYSRVHELTPKERLVLELLSFGKGNMTISQELKISVKTVEAHVSNILSKLGARSRTEALRIAVQRGLVVIDDGQV